MTLAFYRVVFNVAVMVTKKEKTFGSLGKPKLSIDETEITMKPAAYSFCIFSKITSTNGAATHKGNRARI